MGDTSEGTVDFKLPSIVREECTCRANTEDVVSGLRRAFDVVLQVEDSKLKNVDENGCSDITMTMMSEKSEDLEHVKAASIVSPAHSVKCLCKCTTFPLTGCIYSTTTDSSMDSVDNRQEDASFMRDMSLPVARKIISAMKGGREKEGLPPRKLSVSWSPDVYDPPPSSVSHLPKRSNRSSKKYGKGKQKSKNAQGSRKKDKKHHHRKGAEKAEPSLGLAYDTDSGKTLSSNYKPTMELRNFEKGEGSDSPDSNCGSSFLRKSCGALHLTYAETT